MLQSALLLGFWHSELNQYTQPWYWTGNAISLCQIIGLHRDPGSIRPGSSIPYPQYCLWRRLWWTCFFRDRWLSLTLGRPLRINILDCDIAMPSPTDFLSDLAEIPESLATEYIPTDLPKLENYWIMLIQLSKSLGDVLASSNRPVRQSRSLQQVEDLEAQILQYRMSGGVGSTQSDLAKFYQYHMHLHYQ